MFLEVCPLSHIRRILVCSFDQYLLTMRALNRGFLGAFSMFVVGVDWVIGYSRCSLLLRMFPNAPPPSRSVVVFSPLWCAVGFSFLDTHGRLDSRFMWDLLGVCVVT